MMNGETGFSKVDLDKKPDSEVVPLNGLNLNEGVVVDNDDKSSKVYSTYATKKTVAQGMMDLALITANANQLRYLIQYQTDSPTFYVTLVLIIISILLQILVGLCLIYKGRLNIKGEEKMIQAEKVNNFVVVGIFLVTIINVFNAAFFITPTPKPVSTAT